MLSDEVLEKVIARLTRKWEQGNTYVLEQIGKSIKEIGTLSPSKAQQLGQIIKYGGDYDKITKKLAEITDLNVKDIEKIFKEVAKSDYNFSKQFYDYRGKKFIPYDENQVLQKQVKALTNEATKQYIELTKTKALGFTMKDPITKKEIFKPLKKAYIEAMDTAILNVVQGKTTFNEEMYKQIKKLASSGLKTFDYGKRTMRVDSAIRMQMRGALRNLHNETQQLIGKDYDADGVEISVHMNPAPDHAEVQGRQFTTNKYDENGKLVVEGEFEKFQNDKDAKSYDGINFPAVSVETKHDRRSISEYNCYHYVFAIILGVNKPEYSNSQLQKIIDDNNKGFEYNGKHYTNYEGTQLQRAIETEIRKAKDEQISARAAGIPEDVITAQKKITALTNQYKELNKVSGLKSDIKRARVSGYRRTKAS
jgi:hypothetical protein